MLPSCSRRPWLLLSLMFYACTCKMRSARHRSYGNYIPYFSVLKAACFTVARGLVLCQTKHSLPLYAASRARTNHRHWAFPDMADAWGRGEITRKSVGVAFSLFSFCRKGRKKRTSCNSFEQCWAAKVSLFALTLSTTVSGKYIWSISDAYNANGATGAKGEINSSLSYPTSQPRRKNTCLCN